MVPRREHLSSPFRKKVNGMTATAGGPLHDHETCPESFIMNQQSVESEEEASKDQIVHDNP
jgi:hypothetical protein